MILGSETNHKHHENDEDKADQIFDLEETLGSAGDSVSNVFNKLTLFVTHGMFFSTAGHTWIVEDIDFFDGDDLDDGPDEAEEAADADDDDQPLVGNGAMTCTTGDEQVFKPVVNSKHQSIMNELNNKLK